MPETLTPHASWRTVLDLAKKEPSKSSYAYSKHIVHLANQFSLKEKDVIELALHLGIKLFPRGRTFQNYLGQSNRIVAGLPPHWIARLSELYFSISYQNPDDHLELISVVPSGPGFLPHIVHQTSDGNVDPEWFNKIVPTLYALSRTDKPENAIGKAFKQQPLNLGNVNSINHFFQSDPILHIAGVCLNCYQVSLPKKGFGVRLLLKNNPAIPPEGVIQEIRFSARKRGSSGPTSRPYVTEAVIAGKGMQVEENGIQRRAYQNEQVFTMLDSKTGEYGFTKKIDQEMTHIDARLYDFDKLTMRLPVCTCAR